MKNTITLKEKVKCDFCGLVANYRCKIMFNGWSYMCKRCFIGLSYAKCLKDVLLTREWIDVRKIEYIK